MNILLIVLFALSISTYSHAQTSQQPESKPEASVRQRRVVDINFPKPHFRPKLTLQRALQLAEKYIAKEKIDLSPYYLYQAKYILYGSGDNKEPCWFFWWDNESGALGDYIEIVVSIKTRNVRRITSM